MADGDTTASVAPLVERARDRARFYKVRSALLVVLSLMFLAGGAGFAWGMWEEVAKRPQECAALETYRGMPLVERWGVHAATYIAERQGYRPERRAETAHEPVARPIEKPHHRKTTRPPKTPRDVPVIDNHQQPKQPDPPKHVDVPKPKDPVRVKPDPLPKEPDPIPVAPTTNGTTSGLLERAHKAFDTAWAYHLKARPSAPARGRAAATRNTIKHLEKSRKLYLAVMKRRITSITRKRIERRMVDLNALLYWSYKHKAIK